MLRGLDVPWTLYTLFISFERRAVYIDIYENVEIFLKVNFFLVFSLLKIVYGKKYNI